MEEMRVPPLSVFVGPWYLQNDYPEWNKSHSLRYHVHLIANDVKLKDAISFTYCIILTAGTTTGAGQEPAKVLETYKWKSHNIEREEGAHASDMRNYFIASEIPEQ